MRDATVELCLSLFIIVYEHTWYTTNANNESILMVNGWNNTYQSGLKVIFFCILALLNEYRLGRDDDRDWKSTRNEKHYQVTSNWTSSQVLLEAKIFNMFAGNQSPIYRQFTHLWRWFEKQYSALSVPVNFLHVYMLQLKQLSILLWPLYCTLSSKCFKQVIQITFSKECPQSE